jgi:hypothetical protein
VAVDLQGAARIDGTVGFRPPATAGATLDGRPIGPDASELAALTAAAVAPRLEVTLPGTIVQHDGDHLDGRTVTWDVPVDGTRPVHATSQPPSLLDEPLVLVAAGLAGLVVVAGLAWGWRRRVSRGV